jgi:small subunit ribosomal protein S3
VGQKIHPLGFRLGISKKHAAQWFAKPNQYSVLVDQDRKIRESINKFEYGTHKISESGLARIEIQRRGNQIDIHLWTVRPGLIVGKNGAGIEELHQFLKNKLKIDGRILLNIHEIKEPDLNAFLIAQSIAQQLEKRVAFRRAMRQAVQKVNKAGVLGIKIQIGGRLNGAEIARTEWMREGRVPLQTLRANIDYATARAQTIYGVLGIKVWIFNGEIMPGDELVA